MRTSRKAIGLAAIVAALVSQAAFPLATQADDEASVLVLKPADGAAQNQNARAEEELPALPPPRARRAKPSDTRTTSYQRQPQDDVRTSRSFMRPVDADGNVVETPTAPADESIPAPPSGEQVVYPVNDIEYDTDRDARRLYASSGIIETVMITENPTDGCLYEIPLCLPACCVGEPIVEHRRGLFGRGVVEYCWPCGLEVEVKFRLRGDVKVDYDG